MHTNCWGPKGISTDTTLDRAILRSAAATPDAVAVVDGQTEFTYAQLVKKSSCVAAELRRKQVSVGDRVCLLAQRNGDSLSAALGIMMAGGIYVPITPDYPSGRIRYIIRDCVSHSTITDGSCMDKCPDAGDFLLVQDITGTDEAPLSEEDPRRAAYILYTSGSTGQPKGVVVQHSALMNTLAWMADAFGMAAGECIPQKTPWGFTDSLWELFLPLLVGGKVVFIDEETVRDPVALYQSLNRCGAVMTQFVPPALSAFLDEVCRAEHSPVLPNLRWILNGGEELPRSLVERWFSAFPNVGYANAYGMTESAIYATCYFMKRHPAWGMRRIPVGRPITNTEIVILDEQGGVLGADQVGEICVGGKGLMSGYWAQPEVTAQVLVDDPRTGGVIYRTGDYGSWRCDGEIAYLGRRDHQVKIRGMRVELEEIEQALTRRPSIKQAVALTEGDGVAKSLIAFYTVHGEDPGEDAILAYLADALPSYMIPARCLKLNALPTTPHGKTDRAQLLRLPRSARIALRADKVLPGSIEEVIGRIWASLLGKDDFDLDTGFFAAGGNSLLMLRVLSNLPRDYQRVLTVPDLLHFPTIRSLADKIRADLAGLPLENAGPKPRRNPAMLQRLRDRLEEDRHD